MDYINVFFIDTDKFLENIDKTSLDYFLENNTFKSEKRRLQYSLGRFLVKFVLKNYYNMPAAEIIVKNKKPCLKDNDSVKFSISHSDNIILAAFCNNDIGADIEFMKDRDFNRLLDYYKVKYSKKSDNKEFFYDFWTKYEAEIKLQQKALSFITMKFMKNYMLSLSFSEASAVSDGCGIKTRLRMYELTSPRDNITPKELISLKPVIDSNKNENTVVAQEINTAQFDFR